MPDLSDPIDAGLRRLGGYQSIYVPEFVYNGYRIDAIVIDLRTRWIRGFEIKRSRSDFRRDEKWTLYSQFCSSLSIVCPEGVVQVATGGPTTEDNLQVLCNSCNSKKWIHSL